MTTRTTHPAVAVGHHTDAEALTGCTVVLLPPGSRASYEVRGGAPAERELLPLEPDKSVDQVDAVLLTGGSVPGLAAADGVVRALRERGRGVATPAGPVPIVPTLGLFDLAVGDPVAPTADHGRAAVASAAATFAVGDVGAGTGARWGKWRGELNPGGVHHARRELGGVVVEALVAVNAAGSVVGPDDDADATPLLGHGSVFGFRAGDPAGTLAATPDPADPAGPAADTAVTERGHTTIGVVWTNARLDKQACRIVAQGAHDGLARAITPPHTRTDGDGFVACSLAGLPDAVDAPVDVVRLLALGAVMDAVRQAGAGAGADAVPRPDGAASAPAPASAAPGAGAPSERPAPDTPVTSAAPAGERVLVADIDGTCAHRTGRSPYDESRVGEDVPDEAVRLVLTAVAASGCRVVYLSGRTEGARRATEAWLALHGFPAGDLWMRASGDGRPDTVVKRELYERHLAGTDVVGVVDDRPSVCRMWRDLGLTVLQVGDPHVEF